MEPLVIDIRTDSSDAEHFHADYYPTNVGIENFCYYGVDLTVSEGKTVAQVAEEALPVAREQLLIQLNARFPGVYL